MADTVHPPRTLSYGQTILWIANSIGDFMSYGHLLHDLYHLNLHHDFSVEPNVGDVARRLDYARTDDPEPRGEPLMAITHAVTKARDQLYDALYAGRVTMTGHPNWEAAHIVRSVPRLECTNLCFREESNGVTIATVKTDPGAFWSVIRFDSSEIMREWPVNHEGWQISRIGHTHPSKNNKIGRPVGTTKEAEDMPIIIAVEKMLADMTVSSTAAAVRRVAPDASDSVRKRIARSVSKRKREKKGE